MRVLVFGDSIAHGHWDTQGGWVDRLKRDINQKHINKDLQGNFDALFNLGVDGDDSSKLVNRIEGEIKHREWPGEDFLIIVAIGTNDSRLESGVEYSNPEIFAANLELIDKTAGLYTNKILYLGIPPVVDSIRADVKTNEIQYNLKRTSQFNSALEMFCSKQQRLFVDLMNIFLSKSNWEALLPDGLHANDDGHELIYSTIKPMLNKMMEK